MSNFLTVLEDFCINNRVCIYPDYSFNFNNIDKNTILQDISNNLNIIIKDCNIKDEGIIVLLDLGKIDTSDLDLSLLKTLVNYFQDTYPDILYKIIIYNYSFKFLWILNIFKKFMDKETAKKIVIDKNIGKTLNALLENKSNLLLSSN